MTRQLSLFPKPSQEHGGSLSRGKRKIARPLSTKHALHITLKSDLATGKRSLLRHRNLIEAVAEKAARLFNIRIYRYAICGNHLHYLIKGGNREDIQNFFRVFAGHTAQGILNRHPLEKSKKSDPTEQAKETRRSDVHSSRTRYQRKFWDLLLYSRVLSWGREFKAVCKYILKNTLEALHLIAYGPRLKLRKPEPSGPD